MSEFIAQIRAELDSSAAEKKLEALTKNHSINLDVKLTGNGADLLKSFDKQISSLNLHASKSGKIIASNFNSGFKSVNSDGFFKDYFKQMEAEYKKADKLSKEYSIVNKKVNGKSLSAVKAEQAQIAKQIAEQQKSQLQKQEQLTKINEANSKLSALQGKDYEKFKDSTGYEKITEYIKKAKEAQSSLNAEMDKGKNADFKKINSDLDKMVSATKKAENQFETLNHTVSILDASNASNKTLSWLNNNNKAVKVYGDSLREIAELQKKATTVGEQQALAKRFNSVTSEARRKGLTGNSLGAELKRGFGQISQFVGVYGILQEGVDVAKSMANAVLDVDTAMTNLYKVTDETSSKYNEFLSKSGNAAKLLGRDMSSYIEQTATWAKLGYSLDQSGELAKVSSIYANVGEVDDETAVSDIVTAMKAFDIQASDSMQIIDKLNILGNEFATSSADLGTGLSNSASALALGAMDINKALALLTGGAEITQNAGELGNALKIGQMRVMGMKGELEELGEESEGLESVSKIQTHILNLTKGQVNIMNDADPSKFKDYYDILEDVSEVYSDLSQTKQADLLETLFGKQRGNQGAALIQAFQSGQIQKAYQTVLDSSGSAQAEQDRWMDSMEAKIQQFQAQFQEFSNVTLDSGFLKGLTDSGTAFLGVLTQIIDKAGILPTVLAGVGTAAFIKNLDQPKYLAACLVYY